MSLFPSSSTRLVRDLLLRAPVLSHLASDKVRTSLRQRRISLGLNRHQVQGSGSSPGRGIISRPWQSSLPQKTVGTTPCPRFRITDPLALGTPTPLWLTAWASIESQHRRVVYVFKGWGQRPIRPCGSKPTPKQAHCPIP